MLGDLLMGHAYRVGAGALRFGKEKFCQSPIQSLEHDLLHRPHHIRKPFCCQLMHFLLDFSVLALCIRQQRPQWAASCPPQIR